MIRKKVEYGNIIKNRVTNYFQKGRNIWALPSNNVERTVTYESKKLVTKFDWKDKTKLFTIASIRMKHVLKITCMVTHIRESRKKLLTTTNVIKLCIYKINLVIKTIHMCGKTISEFWVIITDQFSNWKSANVKEKTVIKCSIEIDSVAVA